MKISHQLEVRAERIAHRAAVERLREVYRHLAEFETKVASRLNEENNVNECEMEQEVNK